MLLTVFRSWEVTCHIWDLMICSLFMTCLLFGMPAIGSFHCIYVWTTKNTKETTFLTKQMILSLSLDAKTHLSLSTTKTRHCVESDGIPSFFSLLQLFPVFRLNRDHYRVSQSIYSECSVMQVRPTPNTNTFHLADVRILLGYISCHIYLSIDR